MRHGNRMKEILLTLFIVMTLTGCNSYLIHGKLDESLEAYNRSLRWNEWDKASLLPKDSIQQDFKNRAAAAKDVRITEYRIVNKTYDAARREAIVEVEIDYYNVFSLVIKTLHDTQKWAYLDEKGTKGWRLMSLLPEFR
jgi:hypothetical protein